VDKVFGGRELGCRSTTNKLPLLQGLLVLVSVIIKGTFNTPAKISTTPHKLPLQFSRCLFPQLLLRASRRLRIVVLFFSLIFDFFLRGLESLVWRDGTC